MDFFERWFHISPDGGNGSLEAVYLLILSGVVVGIVFNRRIRAHFRRQLRSVVDHESNRVME
jgi:hypothetical protein